MPDDFRVSTGFSTHPKRRILKRRLGAEGVLALVDLWSFCTQNKPTGRLDRMTIEDIEVAAEWNGEPGLFVGTLLELKWLDEEDEVFIVHDWVEHNPFAATSEDRSDKARFSRLAQVDKKLHKELRAKGINKISAKEMAELTSRQRIANNPPADGQPNAGSISISDSVSVTDSVSVSPPTHHTTDSHPKRDPLPPGKNVVVEDGRSLSRIVQAGNTCASYPDIEEYYTSCFGKPNGNQQLDLLYAAEHFTATAIGDVMLDATGQATKNPARWIKTTLEKKAQQNLVLYLDPDAEMRRLRGVDMQ